MNSILLNKYGINKNGLIQTENKQCLCGETLDISINVCPKCGKSLKKTELLNVNKNSALKKRIEVSNENGIFSYKIFILLSKGFDLYEDNPLTFTIDNNMDSVTISDSKYFKTNGKSEEFITAINDAYPGFMNFVEKSLKEQEFEYAITNFSSLSADKLSNFVYIYNHYKALIPYLRGYKILNYGKSFDLKKYFPNIDFNDENSLNSIDIYLPALLTYDLKNIKYLDSIIEIYKTRTLDEIILFNDCVDKVLDETRKQTRYYYDRFTYNEVNDSFSILYNKEISFEDFIRIYQNSRENFFCKILEMKKMLKKLYKKNFSWSDIEKIDRKTYGTLSVKSNLKDNKLSNEQIDDFYSKLESNPTEALKSLLS